MMITAMTVRRQQHGSGCQEEEENQTNFSFSLARSYLGVRASMEKRVGAKKKGMDDESVCWGAGDDEANQEAGAR